MKRTAHYRYKIASENWEFQQIHRLNYQTFVEEIPQHAANKRGVLVDRFDQENEYVICLEADRVVGMLCVRGSRPFSLDGKLENLDAYLPPGRSPCELRLLAIQPECRGGAVFHGLMQFMGRRCLARGHDLALISGTLRQLRLYKHLGFEPFGPVVGTPEAQFQPMYLTLEGFKTRTPASISGRNGSPRQRTPMNLLPGPVGLREEVRQSLAQDPVSHRSQQFHAELAVMKERLCSLVGAQHVEILVGTGTLANDVVAGQLFLLPGPGIVLSNGEFGERLCDHASRFGLDFEAIRQEWGTAVEESAVQSALERRQEAQWLWVVHCETSTGVLNDLETWKQVCAARGIRLCVDCISSIGTVPVDLHGVYLASGVSGKGLAAFPGLSMVFYSYQAQPAPDRLPRYLDLGLYASQGGVPFTHSSNLLAALAKATEHRGGCFEDLARLSAWLRPMLRQRGFVIVAPDAHASPAVITIALPDVLNSAQLGAQLDRAGFLLSYESEYLLRHNWIQICLMGEHSRENLESLVEALTRASARHVAAGPTAARPDTILQPQAPVDLSGH